MKIPLVKRREGKNMNLTLMQLDLLTELINIGIGRAAGIINQMIHSHVQLHVPELRLLSDETLAEYCQPIAGDVLSCIRLPFEGSLSGLTFLIFPPASASSLISITLGLDNVPFDEDSLRIGTLEEIGNIVLNGVMGSIGNFLGNGLRYSFPSYTEDTYANLLRRGVGESARVFLLARTQFVIADHLIEGEILIIFRLNSFHGLLAAMDRVLPVTTAEGEAR
jgi:chemotaxis protein CheC